MKLQRLLISLNMNMPRESVTLEIILISIAKMAFKQIKHVEPEGQQDQDVIRQGIARQNHLVQQGQLLLGVLLGQVRDWITPIFSIIIFSDIKNKKVIFIFESVKILLY